MRASAPSVENIRKFWESHPVAAAAIPHPLGTPEYFKCYDRLREANESLEFSYELHEYRRFAGKRVLDVGCGNGYVLAKYVQEGAEAFGIDLTRIGIELCRQRFALNTLKGHFVVGNAEVLPYPNGMFDCVCSTGVLHHLSDAGKAVAEIYRVLKSGGRVVLMVYHRNSANYRLNILLNHWRTGGSMSELVRTIDGVGNPRGEVYSKEELRRLLDGFDGVSVCAGLLQDNMVPKLGSVIPKSWLRRLQKRWGWFLYAKGVKP